MGTILFSSSLLSLALFGHKAVLVDFDTNIKILYIQTVYRV